jgi:hypothetical protein
MVRSKSNLQILDLLKLKDKKIEEIMKDILKVQEEKEEIHKLFNNKI